MTALKETKEKLPYDTFSFGPSCGKPCKNALMTQKIRAALHWTPPPTDIPESKPFYRNLPESKTLPSFCRKPNRSPGTQTAFPEPSRNPNRLPGTFPEPLAPSRNPNRPPGISLKDSNCKQRQGSHQAKQEGKIASASLPACQWEGPCQFMGRPKFSCDLRSEC